MRRATTWLTGLALAGLLLGCTAPGPGAPAGSPPSELRIAMVVMPKGPNLDPAQTSYSNPEFTNLYNGLTEIDNKGTIGPALATEWKNVDPTTWEFKLRKGVKFHNGEDFTAESVKFSLDRIRDPALKSPLIPFFSLVREIQIVDEGTVRIVTTEPYAPLPARVERLWAVPPKLVQQVGAEAFNAKPVGTGPYKFVEWIKGERLVLEANESYWRGAPKVKKLTFVSAPEASTRVAKLLNNEVDLIETVLDADIPRLKADSNVKVIEAQTSYTNFISIPSQQKPFDDKRVRQALNYAVDMESIIAKVMGGHAVRLNVSNAHTNFGYDSSIPAYPYDVAKAKALLAEAGFNGNFPPQELDVGQGRQPYNVEVSEAVAGYLTAAGVPTKVNVMESNAEFAKYVSGKAGLIFNATLNEQWDSDSILSLNFHSKQRGLYYNTPRTDELLDQARRTFNAEERKKLYSEVQKILREDAPHLVLYDVGDVYAARKNVEWEPLASRNMPFWGASIK